MENQENDVLEFTDGGIEDEIATEETQEVQETQDEESSVETLEQEQDNELKVESKEGTQETSHTYTEKEFQEELKKKIDSRFAREQKKKEKEMQPYKQLVATLMTAGGFQGDISQLNENIRSAYKEQGIEVPELKTELSESEQRALAELDAKEVIESGEDEMQARFTELYTKPNRTIREDVEMFLIGKEHSLRLAKKELLELGADPEKVMNDPDFKSFASKMGTNVSTKEIYQYYQKIKGVNPKKPPSAGSVKSNIITNEKIDYNKMSKEDFEKELDKALNG